MTFQLHIASLPSLGTTRKQCAFALSLELGAGGDTKIDWSLTFDTVQCRQVGYMSTEQVLNCRVQLQALVASGIGEARFDDYDHALFVTVGGNGVGAFWIDFALRCPEIGPENSSGSAPGLLTVDAKKIPLGPDEVRALFDFINQWAHESPM
jgi:hypothetical protein